VVAAVAASAAALLYLLAVRTGRGQDVDEMARESRKLTELSVRRAGTAVLHDGALSVVPVALVAALVHLVRRGHVRRAALAATASLASAGIVELLKDVLLDRPALSHPQWSDTLPTFPSGHAQFGTVTTITVLLAVRAGGRRPVGWLAGVLGLWVLAIAGSGWHRPSDIVAATFIGCACFAFASAFDRPDDAVTMPATRPARRWPGVVAALVAAAVVVIYFLPLDPGPAGYDLHLSAYVATSLTCVAVGVGTVVLQDRLWSQPSTVTTAPDARRPPSSP